MFNITGVDGIMVGRASLGNPWIFKSLLEEQDYIPTYEERCQVMLQHLELLIQEKGEYIGIREMRKHLSGYTKALPHSSEFRVVMNKIEEKQELIHWIESYFQRIKEDQ